MRKKASRPSGGSPFVFFGVTLSAQSDFLNLGGSELEGPDSLPLLILHLCDCNRSVGVVTVVLCAADLVLGSELDLGVGQNDLAAALECTVDGQSCRMLREQCWWNRKSRRRRSVQLQFPYGSN